MFRKNKIGIVGAFPRSWSALFLLAVMLFCATAAATVFTPVVAPVGEIMVNPSLDYDEVKLEGSPDLCGSPVTGDWKKRARIFHADSGYETTLKVLLAAKMAGADVRIVGESQVISGSDRCVLNHLDLVE